MSDGDPKESAESSDQASAALGFKETLHVETIFIRPQDGKWIMGEDWEIEVPMELTIVGLKKYIEARRGISEHRQLIRLRNGKLVPPVRENWNLRRVGVSPRSIVCVEPSFPGAWLWNELPYYVNKLIKEVLDIVDNSGGTILLSDLNKKIRPPPPIKIPLRVFLRKYPEYFLFTTETLSDKIWIQKSSPGGINLPSFVAMPMR